MGRLLTFGVDLLMSTTRIQDLKQAMEKAMAEEMLEGKYKASKVTVSPPVDFREIYFGTSSTQMVQFINENWNEVHAVCWNSQNDPAVIERPWRWGWCVLLKKKS